MTLEVPPKKEIIVYAPLTTKQESLYSAVVNNTISKLLGQEKVRGYHSLAEPPTVHLRTGDQQVPVLPIRRRLLWR